MRGILLNNLCGYKYSGLKLQAIESKCPKKSMKSQQYEMNDIWINYSAREANVRIT